MRYYPTQPPMTDRAHNFVHTPDQRMLYCTQCGHIALDRSFSVESQFNVDAQRVAKQPCPRARRCPCLVLHIEP